MLIVIALRRQPDQHIRCRAEQLHLSVLEACGDEIAADALEICRRRVADFEQYAAREVDAELETAHAERNEGYENGKCRDRQCDLAAAPAEKIDMGLFLEQSHRRFPIPVRSRFCGRQRPG